MDSPFGKRLAFVLILLLLLAAAPGALADVNPVTPSTNDINRANGWAHVNQTAIDIGSTTLQFVQPRAFFSCFEYRTDGDTSQKIGATNYNPSVTDGLYPYTCLSTAGATASRTFTANAYVEVRMVFGAESDERFDWTRFDVLQLRLVGNLQPSWTAPGGGGVFSAYVGPTEWGYVSPGATAAIDGREAGIIKAGFIAEEDPDEGWDEGLFGFIPNVTIDSFAAGNVSYDVQNAAGVNPVWMTIEIDTGTVGDRSDNTVYQHVPAAYPSGWNTIDAAAGNWQKWNNNAGDTSGNPLISLGAVAAAHPGLNVVRAYLRLGQGNSYYNGGTGTIGWVDKLVMGSVTYDFVVIPPLCTTECYVDAATGDDSFPGTAV